MKKSLSIIICLILTVLCLVSSASADGDKRTITVTGTATVTVDADRASLNLGVRTTADEASEASRSNAEKVQAVKDALKEAGIPEENITTAYFYVNAMYDYSSFGGDSVVKGYQVSNSLQVVVTDIDRAGEIIDIALGAGANSCDGITFQSSSGGKAYDDALSAALKEGSRKARLAAAAMGYELGDVLSVTENYGSYTGTRMAKSANADGAMAAASPQIVPDGLDFTASVQMTFELE